MIYTILGIAVLLVAALYWTGLILRAQDSPWLAARMGSLFPLLHHRYPDKGVQMAQLAAWAAILPALSYLLLSRQTVGLVLLLALAVWEVYLGATFYLDINDVPGARVHMILHSCIAALIGGYFVRGVW